MSVSVTAPLPPVLESNSAVLREQQQREAPAGAEKSNGALLGTFRAPSAELPPAHPAPQPPRPAATTETRGDGSACSTSSAPPHLDSATTTVAAAMGTTVRPRHVSEKSLRGNDSDSSVSSSPFISRAGSAVGFDANAEGQWMLKCIRDGTACSQGPKSYMEDRQISVPDLALKMPYYSTESFPLTRAYFGVFDGHGGSTAAQWTADNLLRHILSNSCFPENLEQVLSQAFSKTDQTFESEWASGELEGSGTTALAAVLWGRMITVANLGDCRAVVSRRGKALDITQDQKPSSEMELERIEEAGGRVCCEGYLNGVLGVSRAIGNWHVTGDNDILLKRKVGQSVCGNLVTEGPLISAPEVWVHKVTPDDEFMVLATDGLWDVFTSQRCVEEARSKLQETNDPQLCAEYLVASALQKNTADNVSVQVVCFGESAPPKRAPSLFGRNLSIDGLNKLREALGETPTPSPSGNGSFSNLSARSVET